MKYIIYIDESNTSGKKQERDPKKLIAASWYLQNDELDNFAKRITNGHILKGTDLLTKDMNDVLKLVMKNLESKNSWGVFMSSTTFLIARERTFDLFYYDYRREWGDVEWIRQKIMSFICDEPSLSFFNSKTSKLSKNDIDNLRYELLNFMRTSVLFSNNEIKKIEDHFSKVKITDPEIHIQNNHSSIIGSAVASATAAINIKDWDELEIIIDDFEFTETKARIDFEMSAFKIQWPNIKYVVKYASDRNVISLQVADWIASIYRKSCESIYKILFRAKKEGQTLDINDNIFIFHSKILKSLWKYSQNTNIQVSPWFLCAFELISTKHINGFQELENEVQKLMKTRYNDNYFREMVYKISASISTTDEKMEEYLFSLLNGNDFHRLELEKMIEETDREFLKNNNSIMAHEWLDKQNKMDLIKNAFMQNNKRKK